MQTSYFGKLNSKQSGIDKSHAISISGRAPDWFDGHQYKKLAPSLSIFQEYNAERQWSKDHDVPMSYKHYIRYIERFIAERLAVLDPQKTFDELCALTQGYEPILMCYEVAGDFCHRRIVANWFEYHLGVSVFERVYQARGTLFKGLVEKNTWDAVIMDKLAEQYDPITKG